MFTEPGVRRAAAAPPGADPMAPTAFCVRRTRRESRDVVTIEAEPAAGPGEFVFAPGQFNMLYLFGHGEAAISISGDPTTPQVLVHTIRAVGSVTEALCRLRKGQVLGVRGPFGSGWPVDEAVRGDLVIVAGGVGLPPLRPVLYHVLAQRDRYRRVALPYGARTPDDLLYQREVARWRGRFDVQVEATVDAAPSASWRGHVGVVTTLIARAEFDPEATTVMVCGPEVMMRFAIADLRGRGVPPGRIYLSMERNMKCAIGFCGHCQFGPTFVCRDGPVFRYDRVEPLLRVREL